MREYKFRAWDNYHQEMINWEQYKTELVSDDFVEHGKGPLTIMQYTGLKDINGKEIYEGDIVKNTTQQSYLGQTYEVTWNENWACYQLMDNGLTSNIPLSQDFMSYEVIGNIYENPELIKGRQ